MHSVHSDTSPPMIHEQKVKLYLVATLNDAVTVIYYAPNPQIWYIEMVGHAARWTKKKVQYLLRTVFRICVAFISAHLRRERETYKMMVGQAFVNLKILSFYKDDILMYFIY
jgi:hypothetical protein